MTIIISMVVLVPIALLTAVITSLPAAKWIVMTWVKFYTSLVPPRIRIRRYHEVLSDIHEQINTYTSQDNPPSKAAPVIMYRWAMGLKDDISWCASYAPGFLVKKAIKLCQSLRISRKTKILISDIETNISTKERNMRTRNWLLGAGLITGLAGILWAHWILFFPPIKIYYNPIPIILSVMPLLCAIIIASKHPLLGGILLIVYGLLGPINAIVSYLADPFPIEYTYFLQPLIQTALAHIIPGILFILAVKAPYPTVNNKPLYSKTRLTGLLILAAAVTSSFVMQIIRFSDYPYNAAQLILAILYGCTGYVIVAAAVWVKPRWGGAAGICFSILMIGYLVWLQSTHMTVTLMDMKYELIPTVLMLTGSIFQSVSTMPKLKPIQTLPVKENSFRTIN